MKENTNTIHYIGAPNPFADSACPPNSKEQNQPTKRIHYIGAPNPFADL